MDRVITGEAAPSYLYDRAVCVPGWGWFSERGGEWFPIDGGLQGVNPDGIVMHQHHWHDASVDEDLAEYPCGLVTSVHYWLHSCCLCSVELNERDLMLQAELKWRKGRLDPLALGGPRHLFEASESERRNKAAYGEPITV
jgi:hypothetical protein